jgi:hypothetical protein
MTTPEQGDPLAPHPPDHEDPTEEDPPAELVMNPDAGQPLDDVEDGEDIGDEDLDGPDEEGSVEVELQDGTGAVLEYDPAAGDDDGA